MVCVSILMIFQNLYNGIIKIVNGIIDVLNKIPGVSLNRAEYANFANSALENMVGQVVDRNQKLQEMVDDMSEVSAAIETQKTEFANSLATDALEIQTTATDMNESRDDRVASRNDWIKGAGTAINDALGSFSLDNDLYDVSDNTDSIANSTGSIADSMEIAEEDLKYLRDIAEQEVINRYTTASINVEMNNNNNITKEADLDGIVSELEDKLYEMSTTMAEGVHK